MEKKGISSVERMSVARKTKDRRLCTVFCFAERADRGRSPCHQQK